MVYNLRSIGMSLMDNAGQSRYSLKPAQEGRKCLSGSSNTASASSLNIPAGNHTPYWTNQNAVFNSYSHQNTNQNHATDTYVSLMSTFEENRTSSSKYKRRKQTKQAAKMEMNETSVINLDSSFDVTVPETCVINLDSSLDPTIPDNSSINGLVLDTSNNSTPNTSSSSVASSSSQTDRKLVCSILNCAVQFSSRINLENHMELFKHSPCNPCLLVTNCKLSHIPICYMCPDCDLEFTTRDECTEHINRKKHLPFFPPLAITAYMCSQCLHLFGSFESCWTHMEQSSHHGMSYPFANDYATDNKLNGPVAVAEELVQDMISKCSKVVYSVQCLECGMPMETPAILKHHMRETQNQHVVAALTETSLVEVFASYLASYSCNSCHRLFTGELMELAKHQCARRIIGTIIENDTRSFAEFIKRCALTVIKSLELENLPGPSRNVRLSPVCDRRNKNSDSASAGASEFSKSGTGQRNGKSEVVGTIYCDSEDEVGTNVDDTLASKNTQRVDVSVRQLRRDMAKNSFATATQSSSNSSDSDSHENKAENIKRKNENKETNKKVNEVDVIVIDEESEETDVDFAPDSGAKRKRKMKTAKESKNETSKFLDNFPVAGTSSSSPNEAQQKSDSTSASGSPLFVTNYKPRSSRLSGNILTQGYVVQPSEHRLSPVKALAGGSQQVQRAERAGSPSRYMLRTRNAEQTTHNAESQDSEGGFGNIAQRFLQDSKTTQNTGSRQEANDSQQCKRDRSRSPLSLLDVVPNYQPNILTRGHSGQPYLNPVMAVQEFNGIVRPICQAPMVGPSRYQLRNRCGTTRTGPLIPPLLPIPSLLQQPITAGQMFNPPLGPQPLLQNPQSVCPAQTSASRTSSFSQPQTAKATPSNIPQPLIPNRPRTENLIATEHLTRMKNIVFLDLDNWPSFFHKLPRCLPDLTFVWGFFGGKNPWYEPNRLEIFREMKQKELFYLNERCGATKDAADFAIVLAVGKMDEKLPTNIAFTIMSGDKGFCEVERQMRNSERKVMVVNPHTAAQFSNDMIYALVTSVTDT